MESNREESLRCIEIALNKYNEGNLEGCIKFLNKSNSLYPNDRAKELLATYSSTTTTSSSKTTQKADGSTTTTQTTTTTTTEATTTETADSPKPKYTAEQVAAIKRIRACKSFYEVLEVPKTANENEIKKAYRKLALQMHPDKNHAPGSDDAFKIVTQAFSCLSDPKKRQTYDLHGSEDTPINRSPFTRGGGVYYDDDFSPEDIFNMFFGVQPNVVRNRRAGAGNNFYYSSSPFGGSGVQFNFGGPPRRRHHHHNQQAAPQQQESAYSLLIILIPLLLFILSLFTSSGSSSYNNSNTYSSLYHFTKDQNYNREKVIPIDLAHGSKIDIQFYVKADFERVVKYYDIDIRKFESDVVNKWVIYKEPYCKRKLELDEIINKNPSDTALHQTIKKEFSKLDLKYCDLLNKNKVFK